MSRPISSIYPSPDPHYWRDRGNRRVRKARLTRNLVRYGLVCVAHTVFAGVVLYVVAAGVRQLDALPELALQHIEIEGLHRADPSGLYARVEPWIGENLFDLDLAALTAAVEGHPWILRTSAKRLLPDTLRVSVVERQPAALALIEGRLFVVDTMGQIVGPSGPELPDDLPVLVGLEGFEGPALPTALRRGVDALAALRQTVGDWVLGVAEVDLSQADRLVARTLAPGPELFLDPLDVARNVEDWLTRRETIEHYAGPITSVDLRWQDRIAVIPEIAPAGVESR